MLPPKAKTQAAMGTLTINCRPGCDSISVGGGNLGPSPVFNYALQPGVHRVTLKGNGKTKTLAVNIVANTLTQHTVSMR